MTFLKNLFGKRSKTVEAQQVDPAINRGVYYLYLIIFVQIAIVFGILGIIMVIGKVIATPLWVFILGFILAIGGFIYIYRKAKRQFAKLRETLKQAHLSDRNYEISIMGGMLTMRIEQSSQRLLELPPETPLLESKTIDTTATR